MREHETVSRSQLVPVVDVVDGVRSSGQSGEGFGFGERGAAVVAAAITVEGDWPGDGARGCDWGRQAEEGGRRGRRTNRLWEMLLQAFLLASLQAGYSRGHHQARYTATTGR